VAIKVVLADDPFPLPGHLECLAFARVKAHVSLLLPLSKAVEVLLEGLLIVGGAD